MIDLTEVERYIAQGQKIQAIKELRDLSGLGLKDAKDAVEAFQQDRRWPASLVGHDEPSPASPPRAVSPLAAVEQAMASGQKILAIKELRSLSGLGLKDAKDLVEAYERRRRWPDELLARFGPAPAPAPVAAPAPPPRAVSPLVAVERAVQQGKLIDAIKELRSLTNFGLKMCKEAVEEYRDHHRWPADVLAAVGASPSAPASAPSPGATVVAPTVPRPPEPAAPSTRFAQHVPGPATPWSGVTVFAQTVPRPPAAEPDPTLVPVLRALESYFGRPPTVRLTAFVTRLAEPGHLVLLDDRACFVRESLGRWVVDPVLGYDSVTHVEIDHSVGCTLLVSTGYRHERFDATPRDAEAALALFRVYAR